MCNHQGLDLLVDRGAAGSLSLFGTVKLLGDELAVPADNCVRLNDLRHLLQGLLAQLLADHCQLQRVGLYIRQNKQ